MKKPEYTEPMTRDEAVKAIMHAYESRLLLKSDDRRRLLECQVREIVGLIRD